MANSLLNLVNNLDGGHINEKCETFGIKCKDCKSCLEYTSVIDDLIKRKCLCSIRITKTSLMKI